MSAPDDPPAAADVANPRGEFLEFRRSLVIGLALSLPLWLLAAAVAWWTWRQA